MKKIDGIEDQIQYYIKDLKTHINSSISKYNNNGKHIMSVKEVDDEELYSFVFNKLCSEFVQQHMIIYKSIYYTRIADINFKKKLITSKNPFNEEIGSPNDVSIELLANYDSQWPSIPWHKGLIKSSYCNESKIKTIKNIKKLLGLNPYILLGVHLIMVITAITFAIGFFSNLVYYLEFGEDYFYYAFISPYFLWTYCLSMAIYPYTFKKINELNFIFSIDNISQYWGIIEITMKVHIIVFFGYLLYLIRGPYGLINLIIPVFIFISFMLRYFNKRQNWKYNSNLGFYYKK